MPKNKIAPGDGERRAQVGYVGQYRVQACLLIRALREGNLEWIKVADPEAKKLDDFQLGSPGRVDAYQIKSSAHPEAMTFHQLTNGNPSLLSELAAGRKAIKDEISEARVVAHLVTSDHPSTSGPVLGGMTAPPTPAHFSAFLKQIWEPVKRRSLSVEGLPEAWKDAWSKFQSSSELSGSEFDEFVQDTELEFSFRAESHMFGTEKERLALEADISAATNFFSSLVADPERIVRLTREQVMQRLGWSSRYEFRNKHEFPIDLTTYQPINESLNHLEHTLKSHRKGYVCVLGSPGSGKSTLLTETLRVRSERIIKYYAFVRDDLGPGYTRGESENFLHDLTLSLDRAGFPSSHKSARMNRQELSDAFRFQLQALESDFRKTGRRTLILVDGLDHVPREYAAYIEKEFLGDLPLPNQIPDGVLFLLGTQTLAPLPPQIRNHLESDPSRVIRTTALSRIAIGEILRKAGLMNLTARQQDRVSELSGGHPLALHYIIELILANSAETDALLESSPDFKGDIEQTYQSYWEEISKDDHALTELMGLLARMRPALDLRWIETWADKSAVKQLQRRFSHYFSREGERWYFFHNSFRRFLMKITACAVPGEFSQRLHRGFHHDLAQLCRNASPAYHHWTWEQIYHLSEADEHQEVIATATQKFFRDQFFDSRPERAIFNDILLARRSLPHVLDPVAAVRLSLIHTEIMDRREGFIGADFSAEKRNLLLEIGHIEAAIGTVRQGTNLLVNERAAVSWCDDFLKVGLVDEAKRIFALIDPLSDAQKFHGMTPWEDEQDFLVTWAKVALHPAANFLPLGDVVRVILQFEFTTEDRTRLTPPNAGHLKNEIFALLAEEFIESGRTDFLTSIEKNFDTAQTNYNTCIHQLEFAKALRHLENHEIADALTMLDREMARLALTKQSLSFSRLLDIAELYAIHGRENDAQKLLSRLKRPDINRQLQDLGRAFTPRFRYDRLIYCLKGTDWIRTPPEGLSGKRQVGIILFENALGTIAWIWAQAWRGNILQPIDLIPLLPSLLGFYDLEAVHQMDWDHSSEIKNSRSSFNTWLVGAFHAHGKPAVDLLCDSVAADWENREKRRYWYGYYQREFAIELFHKGAERTWVEKWLGIIESEISRSDSSSGRVSAYSAQAQAWLIIGNQDRAEKMRKRLMRSSFGVGYRKDHQLETWLRLIRFFLAKQPEKALETIKWIAKCIAGLDLAVESRTTRDAAAELIAVCMYFRPLQALAYFRWFREKQMLWSEEAISFLVIAALEAENAPVERISTGVRDLLIPTAEHGNWYLMEQLAVKICAVRDRAAALQELRIFALAIDDADEEAGERWQLGLARGALRSGIQLKEIGVTQEALRREAKNNSGNNLPRDGDVQTMDELEFSNLTLSDLRDLRHQARPETYFNWGELIRRIAKRFQKDELLEIAKLFIDDKKLSLVVDAIADPLIRSGGIAECRALALQGLKRARGEGWRRFYDGGTRLAAFRTLFKVDHAAAIPLFYGDCVDEDPLDRQNLETLLPFLTDAEQLAKIWEEIEEHLKNLLEGCDEDVDDPISVSLTSEPMAIQLDMAIREIFPIE